MVRSVDTNLLIASEALIDTANKLNIVINCRDAVKCNKDFDIRNDALLATAELIIKSTSLALISNDINEMNVLMRRIYDCIISVADLLKKDIDEGLAV